MFKNWSTIQSYSSDGTTEKISKESTYIDNNKSLKGGIKRTNNLLTKQNNDMFYKIYKDNTKNIDKKLFGKSKNKNDWELLENSNGNKKKFNQKYEKNKKYLENFESTESTKNNKPDIKITRNKDNNDLIYEINYDKDVKDIKLFKNNVKNILKIKDMESIFNDPFFKN